MSKEINKLKKMVKKVLAPEYREEALEIIDKASPFRCRELLNYHNDNKDNIVCMHLTLIKMELVYYGIMEQKETDKFGKDEFLKM